MRNQLKDFSESSVGWIFSLYVFLSFFGGLQIGPVFDIKGPRMLLIAGSICLIAGVLLMGISTSTFLPPSPLPLIPL
jgi:MFS family permease